MTGLLRSLPPLREDRELLFRSLGENTGNLAFWESIRRLFAPAIVPYEAEKIKACGRVIVTDLIWIRRGAVYPVLEKLADACAIPFIPMSVGVQSEGEGDFRLEKDTVRLLKKLEERAVIGVRGEYTAEVLSRHGIKNMAVIGCPSLYYWKNARLRIGEGPREGRCCANFRTFFGRLSAAEKHFLSYCADRNMLFVEQTAHKLTKEAASGDEVYYRYIASWLYGNSVLPFSYAEWRRASRGIRFSVGGRFHGNVVALWQGIKALFLTSDSRTRELTALFRLPAMETEDFDRNKPFSYYLGSADYSAFNRCYKERYETFERFAAKNGLRFTDARPLAFGEKEEE